MLAEAAEDQPRQLKVAAQRGDTQVKCDFLLCANMREGERIIDGRIEMFGAALEQKARAACFQWGG